MGNEFLKAAVVAPREGRRLFARVIVELDERRTQIMSSLDDLGPDIVREHKVVLTDTPKAITWHREPLQTLEDRRLTLLFG